MIPVVGFLIFTNSNKRLKVLGLWFIPVILIPLIWPDICKENNITTVKQALACKQIWSLDNGISLCYGSHKALEKLKAKIRNIFV